MIKSKSEKNTPLERYKKNQTNEMMLFSVGDTATLLDYHDRKVFELVREGKLTAAGDRPGRRGIRITFKSIKQYIDSITIPAEFWQR
ncbi:hypothetical protein KAI46_15810 [bacterium]|nr:hypothetical protein [bacterium]